MGRRNGPRPQKPAVMALHSGCGLVRRWASESTLPGWLYRVEIVQGAERGRVLSDRWHVSPRVAWRFARYALEGRRSPDGGRHV